MIRLFAARAAWSAPGVECGRREVAALDVGAFPETRALAVFLSSRSPLLSQCLARDVTFKKRLRQHLLKPSVLPLEGLQALRVRDLPAELEGADRDWLDRDTRPLAA